MGGARAARLAELGNGYRSRAIASSLGLGVRDSMVLCAKRISILERFSLKISDSRLLTVVRDRAVLYLADSYVKRQSWVLGQSALPDYPTKSRPEGVSSYQKT